MRGDSSRPPDPQLIAAYLDGELEGVGSLANLRQQVQDWLTEHPEAGEEVRSHRQLARLWEATAPPEPSLNTWAELGRRIEQTLDTPRPAQRCRQWGWVAGLVVAASALFAVWWGLGPPSQLTSHLFTAADPSDVLVVASENEVEILRVNGDDTSTLVIGELPLHGLLVLAGPGDVSLLRMPQEAEDGDIEVHMGKARRPMIWAPLDYERE